MSNQGWGCIEAQEAECRWKDLHLALFQLQHHAAMWHFPVNGDRDEQVVVFQPVGKDADI